MTGYTVKLVDTGETITVSGKQTVLEACIEEGIAQKYSCRIGMRLACSAETLEGDVTQPTAHGLTEEGAERFALTYMVRPQSDLRLGRGVYSPSIEDDAAAAGTAADDD